MVLIDIHHLQQLNNWGIRTVLTISPECLNHNVVIEAKTFGNASGYNYQWSEKINTTNNRVYFCPEKDTVIQVITSSSQTDYVNELLPDTSTMRLKVEMQKKDLCICAKELQTETINDSTIRYFNDIGSITTTFTPNGTGQNYCGGFEINLKNFSHLEQATKDVAFLAGPLFNTSSIFDKHPEIFAWLDLLDANVYVIISLLIIVAVINMSSTLLVIIIERSKTIGLLKAMGGNKSFVTKIFMSLGGFIILRGLLWGNLIAYLIILMQNQLEIFTLPQANYFVSVVPMDWALIMVFSD
jgi:lipoprotein-releasing system permease protein